MIRRRTLRALATILGLAAIAACAPSIDEDAESSEDGVRESQDPLAKQYTGIWTNWYREELDLPKRKAEGLLKLLQMRQALTKDNLFDRQVPRAVDCTGAETHRTVDGTCNDLSRPYAGATLARFGRNTDPAKSVADADESEILSPNPREISKVFLTRPTNGGAPQVKEVSFLNLTAASWIQFQTHDWFAHPQQATQVYKVEYDGTTLFIPKSKTVGKGLHENDVTHWWDGSQIYGSNAGTVQRLRAPGGMMKLEGNLLPIVSGKEDSGFTNNWWVGMSMLHTLFAREHNAIAQEIKKAHPDFSDEKVYDVARLVNAAVMAKIHTVEWTPAILDNPTLAAAMNLNWNGGDLPNPAAANDPNAPATIHRPGIVGSPMSPELTKVAYSLTEEFTSVYRLHSLLPDQIDLRSVDGTRRSSKAIETTRNGRKDVEGWSMSDLFYSFGLQHPGQLTLQNFPRFLQDLKVEVAGVELAHLDMGAVDVIRDRERGVPRYNEFRRQLHLKPITRFEDLFIKAPDGTAPGKSVEGKLTAEQQRYVADLKKVYGNDAKAIEKLDLLIGCLAEGVRPDGFGFGETQFQVFVLMASRRLQADRFFTTDYRPEIYTAEGIAWVEKATMKNVILRHYPELAPSLAGVENAFNPWKSM
jgi:hypothetical protein